MELDELKQIWAQSPVTENTNTNKKIMELVKHKSYGPVAALKSAFRKQMLMMAIIPFVLIATNAQDVHAVFTSILFWSYAAFCLAIIAFAAYNYRIVRKMEVMDGMVKETLEEQVSLLEKRANLEIIGMRGVLLFFIVLTEVVPFFQHYRMLDKWHSLHPAIRFGAYAGLLVLQFFLSKRMKQQKVGRHLAYLKELVSEMR